MASVELVYSALLVYFGSGFFGSRPLMTAGHG